MGVFAKYRKFYVEPERISIENARLNRINAALTREQKAAERLESLSPVTKNILNESRRLVKDHQIGGPKAATIAAALGMFKERDFADPAKRLAYRELRALQMRPQIQQKVRPAGLDMRRYSPMGKDFAQNVFGSIARIGMFTDRRGRPKFANAFAVVPCIERLIRREVLFAKGKGGKGYRTPKRRTWASGVPC